MAYRDPDQLPDGTYRSPTDEYGNPLGAPPGAVWDPVTGTWKMAPAGTTEDTPPTNPAPDPTGPPPTTKTTNPSFDPRTFGDLLKPFGGHFDFNNGPIQLPEMPKFTPPTYTPPPAFAPPSGQEVLNGDPGYQFRLKEGEQALQNSAAARGVLRTGGTLKDILNYGQSAASQEYGNAFQRSADTYATNAQSQYQYPYEKAYQSALDQYSPLLTEYSTKAQTAQQQNALDYNRAWNSYLQDYNIYRNQKQDTFNSLYGFSSLGAGTAGA